MYRHLRSNVTSRNDVGDGTATFEDFINFLVRLGPPSNRDSHWRQYDNICDPCTHDYEIILKFDTFVDDFWYLKRRLNVSKHHFPAFFPQGKYTTTSDKTQRFMKMIPMELQEELYKVYIRDFELFGYEKPNYF